MVASFEGRSEPRGRTRDRLVRVKLERAIRPTGAARRPDQKPGKRMNWLGVHSSGWSWIGHAVHDPDSPDDAGFARAPGQRALTSAISRFSRPGTGIWTPPSPLVLLDLDVNRLSESVSVSSGGGIGGISRFLILHRDTVHCAIGPGTVCLVLLPGKI